MKEKPTPSEYLVISRGQWDKDRSQEEIQRAIDEFYVWLARLVDEGKMKAGQRLGHTGKTVSRNLVTDGPFGEAKELVGGYWFILARSLEEAAGIAAGNPCLRCGLFYEIRPIDPERASAFVVTTETPVDAKPIDLTRRALMEPRLSFVTLGVFDLERSVRFYADVLGLERLDDHAEVAFFELGRTWLALYPRHLLAADAGVPDDGRGFPGFTLAHNVRTPDEVDALLAHVAAKGARIVKPARQAEWGGRTGYFADPDGFLWEVAWNPHFPHV